MKIRNLLLSLVIIGVAASLAAATRLGDLAWQQDVTALENKVGAIETWAVGDEISLTVQNAGKTNATLTVNYTNAVMYSSVVAESNTLAKAQAQTDAACGILAGAVDTALAGKANKAWGETTSGGAPAPDDTLVVEKEKLTLTGGGNYSYVESSTGGYWVLCASLGGKWTMQSLADAQNPDTPSTLELKDGEGNVVQTVTSTASREVYAVAGAEMYAPKVKVVNGNDVVTMIFPVTSSTHPTCLFAPSLTNDFAEATTANWPGVVSSVEWTGASGAWTNTVTMVGQPGQGFFKGKFTKEGTVYTNYSKPIGFSSIMIGGITYAVSVETINGKKLMVLTEQ